MTSTMAERLRALADELHEIGAGEKACPMVLSRVPFGDMHKVADWIQSKAAAAALASPPCSVDHAKYVGKCPACHTALPQIASPPPSAGWQMVPTEPTDDMVRAGRAVRSNSGDMRKRYKAMLAASPTNSADLWRPIAEAPECNYRDGPVHVLLYCPGWGGVREGRAGRYPDGSVRSDVANVNGDIGATHWQPLPAPPRQLEPPAQESQDRQFAVPIHK